MFRKLTLLVLFTLLLTPAAFADPDLPGAAANLESIPIGSLIIPMDTAHQIATADGIDDEPENFNIAAYGLANKMLQNNIPLKWAIRNNKVKLRGTTTGPNNSLSLIDSTKNFVTLGVQVGDLVTNVTHDPMNRARVTGFATTTNANDTLTLQLIPQLIQGGDDVADFDNGNEYVIDGKDFTATAERIRPGVDVPAASVSFTSGPFIVSSENPAALAKALEIIDGISDGVPPVLPTFTGNAAQSAVRVYRTTTVTNNVDVRYNLVHKPFIVVSNFNTAIHADILTEAGIPGAAGALGADDEDYTNCAPLPGDPAFDPNVCNWNQINPLDLSLFECATLHIEPHRDGPTGINPNTGNNVIADINVAVQNFLTGGGNSTWQCHSILYLENLDDENAAVGTIMTSLGIDKLNAANPQAYPNSPVPFAQFTGPLDGQQGGSVQGWDLDGGTYDKNEAYVVSHNAANNLIHKAAAAKMPTGGDIGGNIFYLGGHEFDDVGELEQINGRRMMLNTLFVPADRDPLCGLTIEASLIIVKEVINDDGGLADVDDFGITTDAGALVWGAGVPVGDTTTYTADTLTVLADQEFSLSESDLALYSEGLWSCEGGDDLGGGAFDSGTVTLAPGDTKTCTITNNDIAQNPDVTIDKEGSLDLGVDGIANPGDLITYQFSVSNVGDVLLTSVAVTDPLPGLSAITCPGGNPIPSIAVGAPPVLCSATYPITQADIDAGLRDNTATATGQCGVPDCPVTDDDPNSETIPASPAVEIDKEGSFDLGGDGVSTIGDIISYTFDVTNTGNITLTNVAVTDPLAGLSVIDCTPEANPIASLAPGVTVQCTATYAITQADIDAGSRENTATVTGDCPSQEDCPVTDDDPNTEEIPTDSNIDLIKTLDTAAVLEPDGTYTVVYTIQAVNSGNALGTYDLVDTFSPGSGISLNTATALYVAGTEATQTGTTGAYPNFVTGETLAAGLNESWEVTANFEVEAEDVDPADSQCDPGAPVIDTGFYNAVTGVVDEEDTTNNDTCTNLPAPDINLAKTVNGPATLEDGSGSFAAGTYTVVYTITATNNGQGPGFYDLVDDFSPAAGITLNVANAVYLAGTESDQSGLEGAYPNFVTGEALAASLNESWTVTANFSIDLTTLADEDRFCDPADPISDTGFYNAVSGVGDETDLDDNDTCTDLPEADINLAKTVTSGPTQQANGSYNVVYTITATNAGAGPGAYDLDDVFGVPVGVTVTPSPVAAYVSGTLGETRTGTLGTWPSIVANEPLTGGAVETWTVTANFTVNPVTLDPTDRVCADNTPAQGFYNAVTAITGEDPADNDACVDIPAPAINLAKTVTSGPTLQGNGSYNVVYTITATNTGAGPGAYNLDDVFGVPVGVTVTPSPVAAYVSGTLGDTRTGTLGAWPSIVANEPLFGGAVETWTVTANFTVNPVTLDPTDRACADNTPAQGFYNAVTAITGEDPADNDACTNIPAPAINLAKTISSAPVLQDDDTFTVVYQITATNTGAGPGIYDLNDVFGVPTGVTVTPTPVAAYVSGTLGETRTGTLGAFPAIVTAEPLIAGAVETWTVTANFAVDFETLADDDLACADNTPGQGFYNAVTAITGEDASDNDACAPIPPPPQESARATFTVQKQFMDGNNITDATFRIDCNTGLILDQDKTTHIVPNEDLYTVENFEVEFVVTDFTQGVLTCTVWEDPAPTGYTPSYDCDSNTLATCDTGDESDLDDYFEGPCVFSNVDTTEIGEDEWQHLCVIRNYPNPVPVVINKDWVIEGSGGDYIDPYYQLKLSCDNEIITEGAYYSYGKWRIVFTNSTGTTNAQYTAMVIPDWDGGTSCEVSESLQDMAIEIDNGCTDVLAQLGDGDECTITNTVFFEGIPTLNQYGIALLALLMLGMGLVGFRRFS